MRAFKITLQTGRGTSTPTVDIALSGIEYAALLEHVRSMPPAVAALGEWHRRCHAAHLRGDIASPEPPDLTMLYDAMNTIDGRIASSLGNRIVNRLTTDLLGDPRVDTPRAPR